MKFSTFSKNLFISTSLLTFGFCFIVPNGRVGLEFIYILPLSYFILTLIFMRNHFYDNSGFGMKILFYLLWIKNVILPIFVVLSDGIILKDVLPSIESNKLSIFIIIIENMSIFYTAFAIRKINSKKSFKHSSFKVSFLGWCLVILSILVLYIRDFAFLNTARFGVVNMDNYWNIYGKFNDEYGVILFEGLRYFIFAVILRWGSQKYVNTNKTIYFLIPSIVGIFNLLLYFGYNRAQIVITSALIIISLFVEFPKQKKLIFFFLVPSAVIVLISMIITKNFNISLSSLNYSGQIDKYTLIKISNNIELYFNGFWPIATGLDSIDFVRSSISFLTLFSDIYINSVFSIIPGLSNGFNYTITSISLYNTYAGGGGAMLPLSIQSIYYFGYVGIILMNILMTLFLNKLDNLFINENSVLKRCFLITLIISVGLFPCYALTTHIYLISRASLVMYIFIFFSDVYLFKKNQFGVKYEITNNKPV